MKISFLAAALLTAVVSQAQDTLLKTTPPPLTISGYVEAYYAYGFNKPANHVQSGFLYSHNRLNEFNLNLGFLRTAYATERVRANLALAAGTYVNANYAAEPGVLKNVYEANAGVKIARNKNLWLDAGIFGSHIGFESAVSKDCWTVTRSLLAENSPYYESGAKLTYTTDNTKWLFSALALNGWQRITRVDGNSLLSFGTQVQFKPTATTTLNYSTFIGTDKPDSNRLMRYYHDLYVLFYAGKLGVTAGLDIGMEQQAPEKNEMSTWVSPVLILKYPFSEQLSVTGRVEYFNDKQGVIIDTGTPHGFKTTGLSLNLDYAPVSNAVLRLEARTLNSKDDIFTKSSGIASRNNAFITACIAVAF